MDQCCAYVLLVQKKLKLSLCMLWGHEEGAEAQLHSFLISVLDRHAWPTSAALPPWEITHYTHWTRGWWCPRPSPNIVDRRKNLLPLPRIKPHTIQSTALSLNTLHCHGSRPVDSNYLILNRRCEDISSTKIHTHNIFNTFQLPNAHRHCLSPPETYGHARLQRQETNITTKQTWKWPPQKLTSTALAKTRTLRHSSSITQYKQHDMLPHHHS